jgi:hypothetical protein
MHFFNKAKLGESMVCRYFRLPRLIRSVVCLACSGKSIHKHLYSLSKLYELMRTKVERNLNVSSYLNPKLHKIIF